MNWEKKRCRKIFSTNKNIFVERIVFMGSFGAEQVCKLVSSKQELNKFSKIIDQCINCCIANPIKRMNKYQKNLCRLGCRPYACDNETT